MTPDVPTGRGAFDVRALYAALDAERQRRGTTWAAIARETQVSTATVRRARDADDLEADGMLQLVRWLGLAPESFARPGRGQVPMPSADRRAPGILRVDSRALYAAVDDHRRARSRTWSELAEVDVGVAAARLRHLRTGGRTSAHTLVAAARWLGRSSLDFVRPQDGPGRPAS